MDKDPRILSSEETNEMIEWAFLGSLRLLTLSSIAHAENLDSISLEDIDVILNTVPEFAQPILSEMFRAVVNNAVDAANTIETFKEQLDKL